MGVGRLGRDAAVLNKRASKSFFSIVERGAHNPLYNRLALVSSEKSRDPFR
jgi:hypothetical protein